MIKVSDSTQKQQLVQTEGLTRFTGWLFEQVRPFLERGTVWEAGCGIGTYTQLLVAAGCERILASDHDEDLLEIACRRFKGIEQVRLLTLDMSREEDFAKLRGESIRTIVCLNVVEHIENDLLVLRNMRALLAPKGRLVLLVPAHPMLFNGIDREVHHCRRYTAFDLSEKLRMADFRLVRLYYFNAPGILGWFLYGHVLRRRRVPEMSVGLFDRLVPVFRWTERAILRGTLGISLIAICER